MHHNDSQIKRGFMLFRVLLILGLTGSLATATPAMAHRKPDPVFGLWQTQDHQAVVEFYGCGAKICGRFYWIGAREDGQVLRDEHNHDAKQRTRPLCRLTFIKGFHKDSKDSYSDGQIYNPQDGWDYNADMTLMDRDTLNLEGYVLFPLLGRSQTWTRVASTTPCAGARP